MTYANGCVYIGEWADDQPSGRGKMTYADGSVFDGKFVNGVGIRQEAYLRAKIKEYAVSLDDDDGNDGSDIVKNFDSSTKSPPPPPPSPRLLLPAQTETTIDETMKQSDSLLKDVPFPKVGVRISVFFEFIANNGGYDRFENLTTGDVTDGEAAGFVLKATQELKCSYCELLEYKNHSDVGIATVFISHACGQNFLDVVSALDNHFKDTPDIFVWFSSFSNNQHLTPDLPFEWFTSTFMSAIEEFGHTVMVLAPWNDPIPFTRAWCLFEIYSTVATKSNFEVAMSEYEREGFIKSISNDSSLFYKMLADIDVNKSQSWLPDDLARIKHVAEAEVGLENLNFIVKDKMREWVEATFKHATEHNDGGEHNYNEDKLEKMMAYTDNLDATGQHKSSLELCQKCLAGYLSLPGCTADDIRLAKVYNMLAIAQMGIGKVNDALPNYHKSLDIYISNGESASANVGTLYNNIANAYATEKQIDEALPFYMKCLSIRLARGENHIDICEIYNNIGVAYLKKREYDLALEYHNKGLTIALSLGANHNHVGASYCNLANVYRGQKKYDLALEHFQKSLVISRTLGSNHPDVGAAYANIGATYRQQKKYELAIESLQKAMSIFLKLGAEHPLVLELKPYIARCENEQENADMVDAIRLSLLPIDSDNTPPPTTTNTSITNDDDFENHLDFLVAIGAFPQEEINAVKAVISIYGPEHPLVIETKQNIRLGFAEIQGKHPLAIETKQSAISTGEGGRVAVGFEGCENDQENADMVEAIRLSLLPIDSDNTPPTTTTNTSITNDDDLRTI